MFTRATTDAVCEFLSMTCHILTLRTVLIQSILLLVGLATKLKESQLPLCCNPSRGGLGAADTCQRCHPGLWWAGVSMFPWWAKAPTCSTPVPLIIIIIIIITIIIIIIIIIIIPVFYIIVGYFLLTK